MDRLGEDQSSCPDPEADDEDIMMVTSSSVVLGLASNGSPCLPDVTTGTSPNSGATGTVSVPIFESLRSQVDDQASELSLLQTQVQLQNERIESQNKVIRKLFHELTELKKSIGKETPTTNESECSNRKNLWTSETDKNSIADGNDSKSDEPGPTSSKSISELVKETAEEVLQLQEQRSAGAVGNSTGFVYDEATGLYFDKGNGYYYDPHRQLYYNGHTRTYYSFDPKTSQYIFHSQLPSPGSSSTKTKKKDKERKIRKKSNRITKPKKEERPKIPLEVDLDAEDLEDGEISSSSSSSSSTCSSSGSGTVDLEDDQDQEIEVEELKVVSAPCIRGIVTETAAPSLWKGYLFLVTISGGTIGREGNHHVMQIPDPNVSKNHAKISYELDDDILPLSDADAIPPTKVIVQRKYFIQDLGSQNGTWLNRNRLSVSKVPSERFEIAHGSTLKVGDTILLLHIHEGTSTCGHCEPGLIVQESKEPLYPHNVPSKKKQMKKEFKKISKKYGVNTKSTTKTPTTATSIKKVFSDDEDDIEILIQYKDRAKERRLQIGSDNPYEKTQIASMETAIEPANKGFKMLQKMGWNDGMTLGQGNSGISEPVKIHMNVGRSGLGLSSGPGPSSLSLNPPPHRAFYETKKPINKSNERKIQFAQMSKIRKTMDPAPDCIELD